MTYICSAKLLRMRNLLLFLLIALSSFSEAQSLSPGGIAFIGFQGDSPMAIAFVNTEVIEPNTSVSFTDNKWTGFNLLSNEQTATWTSPDTALPLGTVIILQDNGSSMNVIGPGTVTGRIYYSLGQGEQILAYTGPSNLPSFVAGVSNSTWRANCDSIPYLEYRTCLPPPLVNGETAIAFLNITTINIDNGFLNISPLQVFGPEILSIIYNINYWTLDNGSTAGTSSWPDWSSGSTQPFASEINFSQATTTVIEGGSLATVTLTIDQPQPTPQSVQLSVLEFLGITSDDYATNPAMQNGVLSFDVPANATSVSFTFQALTDGISEINETVSFVIESLSGGLTPGSQDAISITILSTEQNFSRVNFNTDTLVITEGQSNIEIGLNISPTAAASYNVVINTSNGAGILNDYFTTPAGFSGQLLLSSTANESSLSFAITPYDDFVIEPDEFVTFTIIQVSNGLQIGDTSTVIVVIKDNDNIPIFTPPALFINELQSVNTQFPDDNGQFDDWIELYNASDEEVNLSGYSITNNITSPVLFTFPNVSSQTTMAPGSYKVLWADQNTFQGPLHLNFMLNDAGGFLALFGPDGETLIDGVQYPPMDSSKNYGRLPDGGENWKYIFFPTPGGPNNDSIPVIDGLFEASVNAQFSVYPNPSSEKVSIVKLGDHLNQEPTFYLMDISGRTVHVNALCTSLGKSWVIDLKSLPAGVYYLQLKGQGSAFTQKIIHTTGY